MRKPKTITCLRIAGKKNNYNVIMERLKNGTYGQPRWKATIISESTEIYQCAYIYAFQGHYMSELMEAAYIVEVHEDRKV